MIQTSQDQEYVFYKGINIKRLMLKTTAKYYELVIDIFVGNGILKRMQDIDRDITFSTVHQLLAESYEPCDPDWVDISGMFAPRSAVNAFMEAVHHKKLDNVDEIQTYMNDIYLGYERASWAWCADLISQRTGKPVSELTADDLAGLIVDWQNSAIKINNMILKDSQKEFSQRSQIGFGIDGDEATAVADFAAVRGTYDDNKFVKETLAETDKIKETAERWLGILQS